MIYCSSCGNKNIRTFIEGNYRYNCKSCLTIHYENPKPTSTLICINNNKLLLGKRAFEPAIGQWGLIGGFMELNETLFDSATRELKEETNLNGTALKIIGTASHFNSIFGDILLIGILMEIKDWSNLEAADDVSELQLFKFNELPNLAFDSHKHIVDLYLKNK